MADDKSTTSQDDERFSLDLPRSRREEKLAKKRAYAKAFREQFPETVAARKKASRTPESLKRYYEANKAAVLKRNQRWRAANMDRVKAANRARNLRVKYDLTPEQYQSMIDSSGGRCAICKAAFSTILGDQPCIDHCHHSGGVRGVICNRCNRMLGLAHDNPKILRQAARYLEKTTAVQPSQP